MGCEVDADVSRNPMTTTQAISAAPIVSIILPVFNRLDYLRTAVTSVFGQSFTDWELIVADDGSDDGTKSYLKSLDRLQRVKVLWLAHTGNPAAVRNAALREARGEFVAFLDSDDEWLPEKLARQIEKLREQPHRLWCYSPVAHMDADGNPLPRKPSRRRTPRSGAVFEQIVRWEAAIAMPAVIAQRQLVKRVGQFDEQQVMHEDCDLWLKLARESEVSIVDSPLSRVRHHDSHYSASGERALRDWVRLFEKWQQRIPEPRRKRILERQRARCTTLLARHYAAQRDRAAVFRTIAENTRRFQSCPEWWLGSMVALVRLAIPTRLVGMWRRSFRQGATGIG
jgi:glycosyltransferase involved in cell wall biosynthesis